MADGSISVITIGNFAVPTVMKQEKGIILGKTTIGTMATGPEFTFGSIDNNKSVNSN